MMSRSKYAKWAVIAIGAIWLLAAGWSQFSEVDTSYFYKSKHYVSSAQDRNVQRKLAKRICKGSFSQRYECRSSIMSTNEWQLFAVWAMKIMIVFGPPLVLHSGYRLAIRQRPQTVRSKARAS